MNPLLIVPLAMLAVTSVIKTVVEQQHREQPTPAVPEPVATDPLPDNVVDFTSARARILLRRHA